MKDNDRPFNLIPICNCNHHNFEEILNFQFSKMSSYTWICPAYDHSTGPLNHNLFLSLPPPQKKKDKNNNNGTFFEAQTVNNINLDACNVVRIKCLNLFQFVSLTLCNYHF